MVYCATKERFASSSRDCLEPRLLDAALVRCQPSFTGNFSTLNDQGVVTLGASYSRGGAGGTYQSADVLYYASGGYYVALTLHQLWPVTVDGKPSTLVWRGDMISSAVAGIAAWRGTAGLGISDDEKYHQSCYCCFAATPAGAGERMKMSVLRSVIFVLAAANFLCRPNLCGGKQRFLASVGRVFCRSHVCWRR